MAIITHALLSALNTGFNASFKRGFENTPTAWDKIATLVPSSSTSNTYGWLGQFPALREWVGERVVKDMAAQGYVIENKLFEATVGVKRTDIEDDNVGVYGPMFAEMGRAAKAHPDEMVFGLLKAGRTTPCYDGQYFFDAEHPVYPNVDGTGEPALVSNFADGAGPAWYLLDTSRVLKPLLFQERLKPELTIMDRPNDERVFMADLYRYGVRCRCNAGFGFWQLAYCSKQPLDADAFNAAIAAMMGLQADGGRPLGVMPTLLVVPPLLRAKALEIAKAQRLENGRDNVNAGLVDVISTPWLI